MLNNTEVGKIMGVSPSTVSRWRSGDRTPSGLHMRQIRSVLTWSVDDQVDAINEEGWAKEFEERLANAEFFLRSCL